MLFNATFNNISVISWRSVLLMEKTGKNYFTYGVLDIPMYPLYGTFIL